MKKNLIIAVLVALGLSSCDNCESVICSQCYEELGDCSSEPAHKEFCPARGEEEYNY
ncbi:hypothetical protein [Flammeovirga aprica]|uniref:Uncharacterized protein n=1 Tax=Flammeovirga aprica JL-4 TaxID=694437 RepID=A0A7X9P383_9BACT|nr:hypothetical protein [Flammeovirga aprica]NME67799.1 hypothetical protein [Flammeovirga aprica JL-4]